MHLATKLATKEEIEESRTLVIKIYRICCKDRPLARVAKFIIQLGTRTKDASGYSAHCGGDNGRCLNHDDISGFYPLGSGGRKD